MLKNDEKMDQNWSIFHRFWTHFEHFSSKQRVLTLEIDQK